MATLQCMYHPCPAEARVKQFKQVSEWHYEQDGWLVECDVRPTKQGILYGMCPHHARGLLEFIARSQPS